MWTLITGAAKGLGKEIALKLAKEGYPLILHYKTNQKAALILKDKCKEFGVEVETLFGDFSTVSSTKKFINDYHEKFSATKNVINNVGNYLIESFLGTSIDLWQDLYQTNVFAPIQIIQDLASSIVSLKGSIINIGVTGLHQIPSDIHSPAYTSSKLILWMLTKTLAKEFVKTGVRVNMVSPGYLENAIDLPKDLSVLPQGVSVSLKEVAEVVAFLLDEKNSSITGQNIEIAGGIRL